MKNLMHAFLLIFSLSACDYSNEFNGTFNGVPALMNAYSKNVNNYCVALTITAGVETKATYINAQSVYNANDLFEPVEFNTKGSLCGANLSEYLVGIRNTKILRVSKISQLDNVDNDYCRFITYNQYQYEEFISLEFKNNLNDQSTGKFSGLGQEKIFVDYDHPVSFSPHFLCGQINYPNPVRL